MQILNYFASVQKNLMCHFDGSEGGKVLKGGNNPIDTGDNNMFLEESSRFISLLDKFKEDIISLEESSGFISSLDDLKNNITTKNKIRAFKCEVLDDCNFDGVKESKI